MVSGHLIRKLIFALAFLSLLQMQAQEAGSDLDERDRQRIRMLFESGTAAHDDGDYETSIRLLNEALSLRYLPIVAVNLGQSYYQSGDYAAAYSIFQTYLEKAPDDDPLRGAVTDRIPELQMRLQMASMQQQSYIILGLAVLALAIALMALLSARRNRKAAAKA